MAFQRIAGLTCNELFAEVPLVVTNEDHRFLVQEQLRELGLSDRAKLLLEPAGRNTAPAITLAALAALSEGDDPVMVVSPADHMVTDTEAFSQTLRRAVRCAQKGSMVVLGVLPTSPETGYGYIQRGSFEGDDGQFNVKQFTEKPELETAQNYLKTGDFLWNGGLFVMKASVWLKAVEQFQPSIHGSVHNAWTNRKIDGQFIRPDPEMFGVTPSISADYAVIERCPNSDFPINVIELNAGWSDLGAWDAVWQVGNKDQNGNVTHGDTTAINTKNSLIHANYRLVGVVGIEDIVVIETPDAVLVGRKDQAQLVKSMVQNLKSQEREERLLHRKVHRP